jgi:hypothetical protein
MNRCFIVLSTAILLILVWPVHGESVHVTYSHLRDNYVYFEKVHHFDFIMKDHAITDGQTFTGWYSGMKDGEGYIYVHAGRKGSSYVANWFKDRADVAVGDRVAMDSWPDKLNFAIYGDIIVKGANGAKHVKCKDIVIGQGHTGSYNNWWIGGKSEYMKKDGDYVWLECPAVDGYCAGTLTVETIEGHSNTFKLPVRACPTQRNDDLVEYPIHR